MRSIIMGAPGAGKGTQAKRIAQLLDIPAISTGDIFRANVAQRTALGREVERYLDRGDYVPDEVTSSMLRDRLGMPDAADGFLLDGYPRTLAQVEELDEMLRSRGHGLDVVLCLVVEEEHLVARLLRRAGVDGRADDTEDVIRHRQRMYREQTMPLLEVYAKRGVLIEVDGVGAVDEISGRVLEALADVVAVAAALPATVGHQ